MERQFLKQSEKALFPEIDWNKPVNKRAAKRLLIIGGHRTQFAHTQTVFNAAVKAGIGEAKVVLPDVLAPMIGHQPEFLFVPSTRSGSIAKAAYEPIKAFASESDGLILAGEFSHHPESISVVEQIMEESDKPTMLGTEAIEVMLFLPTSIFMHAHRLLIADTKTLAKLAAKLELNFEIIRDGGLTNKLNLLQRLSTAEAAAIVLFGAEIIVQVANQTSVTAVAGISEADVAGYMATYWLQHNDEFKALTTAAWELTQK